MHSARFLWFIVKPPVGVCVVTTFVFHTSRLGRLLLDLLYSVLV